MSAGSVQETEEEQLTRRHDTGKKEKGPEKLASRDLYKVSHRDQPATKSQFSHF